MDGRSQRQVVVSKRKGASRPPHRLREITSRLIEAEAIGPKVRHLHPLSSSARHKTSARHAGRGLPLRHHPANRASVFDPKLGRQVPKLNSVVLVVECKALAWDHLGMKDMRMLFSARDRRRIERARNRLVAAGIYCEVRTFRSTTPGADDSCYPELWVRANPDYHTASVLYTSPLQLLRQRV
jgi:hypothetical protein